MFKPLLVRDIVQAVRSRVSIPVTVKCRIGVDGSSLYSFTYLTNFKIEIAMKNWLISFQLLLEFLTRSMSTPHSSFFIRTLFWSASIPLHYSCSKVLDEWSEYTWKPPNPSFTIWLGFSSFGWFPNDWLHSEWRSEEFFWIARIVRPEIVCPFPLD